ncbi:hypothetical protein FACS1894167_13590 [Synergistales bacterium]|nr:hypothetical protein FACS1894167_13590 [Synergistales bacterium]
MNLNPPPLRRLPRFREAAAIIYAIGDSAFVNFADIQKVVISTGIKYIWEWAFAGCKALTIYCTAGSYAERYARKNNIKYAKA